MAQKTISAMKIGPDQKTKTAIPVIINSNNNPIKNKFIKETLG
jgi:hypothetical protein